jgi:hypothetical protein
MGRTDGIQEASVWRVLAVAKVEAFNEPSNSRDTQWAQQRSKCLRDDYKLSAMSLQYNIVNSFAAIHLYL